jgi:uncharacterized protein (TIGR04255 family)
MVYKNNYLSTVIFRIDFSPILLLMASLKPEYQEALRAQFPNLETADMTQHKIMMGNVPSEKKEESVHFNQWAFLNKEKTIKITVTHNCFVVECFKYTSFPEFDESIKTAFNNFKQFYEPIVCKRLGLRYINNIVLKEGNPLIWSDYLSPFLANQIEAFPYRENLSRIMNQFIIARDDHTIIINTGMPNREYPNKISRREFTLDFDCSTEDCEDRDPLSCFKVFHDEIEELFESCITDKLRKLMDG